MTFPVLVVIGLMSGTSMDGIDGACIRVQLQPNPLRIHDFALLNTVSVPFSDSVRKALLQAASGTPLSIDTFSQFHFRMGELFSEAALQLLKKLEAQQIKVDLIASHGQTLWHMPPSSGQPGYTCQIGAPAVLAERTGIPVVADFRPTDMAAGGQGAPLVPFADQLFFQDEVQVRSVLNIGGISNMTVLPARQEATLPVIAFDTGPGNMIIDGLMGHFFGQPYDADGKTAAEGQVHPEMLEKMLSHPYFMLSLPKSTGREQFGGDYISLLLQNWESSVSPEDMVSTATEFTVVSIAQAYKRFVCPQYPVKEVILGGGGARNPILFNRLQVLLAEMGITLQLHEAYGISSQFKECIAFALLGYARLMGIPNTLPSCTGASRAVCAGGLWSPLEILRYNKD